MHAGAPDRLKESQDARTTVRVEEMRRMLAEAAAARRTVTYGQLMKKFGLSRGSGRGNTVVGALDQVDRAERAAGAPGFAALVVREDTGYPGLGFYAGRRKGSGLTPADKEYAKKEREKVWSYYRRPAAGSMEIKVDDLTGRKIQRLLRDHLEDMMRQSPPESMHALDLGGLRRPEVTFWSAWEDGELLGCGALKELTPKHGEVKSMRTAPEHRRRGVAAAMLTHILEEAERRGYDRVSLETGSMDAFAPARRLYAKFGFRECGPFAGYVEDPNSVFMTKALGHGSRI